MLHVIFTTTKWICVTKLCTGKLRLNLISCIVIHLLSFATVVVFEHPIC
jgi:hypothetical protein